MDNDRRIRRLAPIASIAMGAMVWSATGRAEVPPGTHALPLVEGVIHRVHPADGRVTLRHEPIVNLGIPAMTMVFRVKDTRWIDGMHAGAPVRFAADRIEGVFTIIHMERRHIDR